MTVRIMYLSHFNFQEKPFKVTTDPKFLWVGEKHKKTLETLRYGIVHGDGYVVLTGDVGTGKTTLAMALAKDLGHNIAAFIAYPDLGVLDFLKLISAAYGIKTDIQSKASFRIHFESFLRSCFSAGKKAVLILDEAQRMGHEHLQELLQLSSIEESGTGLLNIVFVGQNEFNKILQEDGNRGLRQRIAASYNLLPLTHAETEEYILHRLRVIRCQREIFSQSAIQEIFLHSKGIPRLINNICDLSLLMTYMERGELVQPSAVKQSVERLRLPGEGSGWAGTDHSPSHEEKLGDELPLEKDREVRNEITKGRAGKTLSSKFIWPGCVALIVIVLGIPLFFSRDANDREVDISNQRGEASTTSPVAVTTFSSKEEADRPMAFSNEPSPLNQPEKVIDLPSPYKDSVVSSVELTRKKPTTQPRRAETKKVVSGTSSRTSGESLPQPFHGKQTISGMAKDGIGSTQNTRTYAGISVQAPPENETREAEPGRAIDWILEKRDRN